MPDKIELKEEDLKDEELKKVAAGSWLSDTYVTCPDCGSPGASAWIDYETMEVFDIVCGHCRRGMGPTSH